MVYVICFVFFFNGVHVIMSVPIKRRPAWTPAEEAKLQEIFSKSNVPGLLEAARYRNEGIYGIVEETMQLAGFNRTAKEIQKKWQIIEKLKKKEIPKPSKENSAIKFGSRRGRKAKYNYSSALLDFHEGLAAASNKIWKKQRQYWKETNESHTKWATKVMEEEMEFDRELTMLSNAAVTSVINSLFENEEIQLEDDEFDDAYSPTSSVADIDIDNSDISVGSPI